MITHIRSYYVIIFGNFFGANSAYVIRIINFTYLVYELTLLEYYNYLILTIPLTIMNYIWYYKLINKFLVTFKSD